MASDDIGFIGAFPRFAIIFGWAWTGSSFPSLDPEHTSFDWNCWIFHTGIR